MHRKCVSVSAEASACVSVCVCMLIRIKSKFMENYAIEWRKIILWTHILENDVSNQHEKQSEDQLKLFQVEQKTFTSLYSGWICDLNGNWLCGVRQIDWAEWRKNVNCK